MKKFYKVLLSFIISASLLLFTSPAYSRGSGGGNGGGSSGGHSGGRGTMSGGHGSGMKSTSGKQGYSRDRGMQRSQRQRIHVTEHQRNQIGACIRSADNIQTRIREMQRNMQRSDFSIAQTAQERDRLRNEIRTMNEEHKRFMQGIDNEQQEKIRDRIRSMEREREHIDYHFQKMDEELNMNEPDRDQINYQAREMEQAMKVWQEQYRQIPE